MTDPARVALVTGASRGIGRSVALELARRGQTVAVNFARRADAAEKVRAEIEAEGGTAACFGGDVSDAESVVGIFARIKEELGDVTILVNNAGMTRDRLLVRMTEDEWDEVLAVNLRSAFLCTKFALRGMLRAKFGRIICISSVAGISGNPGQANYAASKAGLIGFVKSVAKEVGSRGITANVVAPGFVETDLTDDLPENLRKASLAAIVTGRFGHPDEVASAVGYLASDEARYITGQVLQVDGGMAL